LKTNQDVEVFHTQRNSNLRRRSIRDGRILWPHLSQTHRQYHLQKSRGLTKQRRCPRGYMEERDLTNRANFLLEIECDLQSQAYVQERILT
jgi:hypothetical protein